MNILGSEKKIEIKLAQKYSGTLEIQNWIIYSETKLEVSIEESLLTVNFQDEV